jgi:pimeloyl-ACP methyl ester carboxylesterase
VLPHLPASIHAFALTHRDHGDANRPAAGYRYHDFAADLAAFMDALDIDSAVFEGSFMGSSVASNSPWTTPSGPSGSC